MLDDRSDIIRDGDTVEFKLLIDRATFDAIRELTNDKTGVGGFIRHTLKNRVHSLRQRERDRARANQDQ
jgi:hypothetical protein